MRLLITGGAGFIGSNFAQYMLHTYDDTEVVVYDLLTYAGNLANFGPSEWDNPRFAFIKGDIREPEPVEEAMGGADVVVNFAAETHVDRSIRYAGDFVSTDVYGTFVLLEAARRLDVGRFIQISTVEVYGQLPPRRRRGLTEADLLNPMSPYAASKAGADRLAYSYWVTYGTPVVITRCGNNYGPNQYPEKLVPLFITNALDDQPLPVYGHGRNTREWIHTLDHCRAVDALIRAEGVEGEVFNIGADCERSALEIAHALLDLLGKPRSLIQHIADRPGHVPRHRIDATKLRERTGWQPQIPFEEGMARTVEWYRENRPWWEKIKSGEFREFYEEWYGERGCGPERLSARPP